MTAISHQHQPVMLDEVLTHLNISNNGYFVDATLGRGGHSMAILKKLGKNGRLVAFDKDKEAIDYVQENLKDTRLECIHQAFSSISTILKDKNLFGKIDGILMDLGVSSPQLDNANRGFSFTSNGPLDMRMDTRQEMTACSWLSSASVLEIADVLYQYSDEKKSRLIAKAIKKYQETNKLETTLQLVKIIQGVIPSYRQKKHPATRTFQALRIFINQELLELELALEQLINCLAIGGRLVLMSFHSLEDRMVKQFINQHSRAKPLPKKLPVQCVDVKMPLKSLGKYFASQEEVNNNIRARSAILRVAQKT